MIDFEIEKSVSLPKVTKPDLICKLLNEDIPSIIHGITLVTNSSKICFEFLDLSKLINQFKKEMYLIPFPEEIKRDSFYANLTFFEDSLKRLSIGSFVDYERFCVRANLICQNLTLLQNFKPNKNSFNCISLTGNPLSLSLNAFLDITQTKGIVFDVDDCLIKSEIFQKLSWFESIQTITDDSIVIGRLKQAISDCFYTGNMKQLLPDLFKICEPFGFKTIQELDEFLTENRLKTLKSHCQQRDIMLFKNVRELLTELYIKGIKIGIYTSSVQNVAVMMLNELLGQDFFDRIIPIEYRLFGDDEDLQALRKPDPFGWLLSARKMGLSVDNVSIIDDNKTALQNASKFGFAGIVGLYHNPNNVPNWSDLIHCYDMQENTVFFLIENLGRFDYGQS